MNPAVAVVIPVYGGAWCIERAVASCRAQSHAPVEIHVVDDCSPDDAGVVVRRLMESDDRIRHHVLPRNAGHLTALRHGLRRCTSDWVALLDADDELVPDSIERRLDAAIDYHRRTGEWPGLVYGDLYRNEVGADHVCRFKSLQGRDFGFLCRELSLCQTSTILLGRGALSHFPDSANPYNTDDEIVLAIGRHHPLLHAGGPVAVAHDHPSPARMTNSAWRRYRGLRQLVRDHQHDIVRHHGSARLFLWRLRVLRAFVEWQNEWAERRSHRLYGRVARAAHGRLTAYLQSRFEQMYF